MDEAKFEEILKLLEMQKQAFTDLSVDRVAAAMGSGKLGQNVQLTVQRAIIFRNQIERRVRELSASQLA